VDVVQGACFLLGRKALEQVGFLDPDYFMYTEEVDLCYRLKQAGWGISWLPAAQVTHFGGQSTHQAAEAMFLRLYESKILFFRKHYGKLSSGLYKLILFVTAVIRIACSPVQLLFKPQRRLETKAITNNYRQLLASLTGF
jgi:GT2 family glycosyltransferase